MQNCYSHYEQNGVSSSKFLINNTYYLPHNWFYFILQLHEVIASGIMRFVIRMTKHGNLETEALAVTAVGGNLNDRNVGGITSLVEEGCIKRLVGILQCPV